MPSSGSARILRSDTRLIAEAATNATLTLMHLPLTVRSQMLLRGTQANRNMKKTKTYVAVLAMMRAQLIQYIRFFWFMVKMRLICTNNASLANNIGGE